jgi:hypothetical protein
LEQGVRGAIILQIWVWWLSFECLLIHCWSLMLVLVRIAIYNSSQPKA